MYEEMGKAVMSETTPQTPDAAAHAAGAPAAVASAPEQHETTAGDKQLRRFRKRLRLAPHQVLRYSWGGDVLWQTQQGQAPGPPPCPRCNAPRCFEAQVMPALFYHLQVEAHAPAGDPGIDCGVAAVFSCSNSCGMSGLPDADGWCEEWIHLQRDSLHA